MSVRTSLTVAVGLVVAALVAGAAWLAPTVVEQALIDDILESEAILQADLIDEQGGFFVLDNGDAIDIETGLPVEVLVADEVVAQLGSDELQNLIDQSGGLDLLVGIGGDGFVRVDAEGNQTIAIAGPDELGQPVLTIFELFDRGASIGAIDIASPSDFFDDDGFIDESLFAQFDDGRIVEGVREVGGVEYFVSADAGSVDRTIGRVRGVLSVVAPVAILLASMAAWLLAGRALQPVRAITERTALISGGTLDERVPVPTGGDEIATLANTMNGMLDRLEGDDRRRRRFVSDASHELRSPVAVLRSEAEVALRTPEGTDVEQLATGVLDESTRMATIIDDLLALARHDEGVAPPTTEVDLDDIVLLEARRARRVGIDVSRVSAGRVMGRSDELARAVSHLLDNAARHAVGRVSVSLETVDGNVLLTVDDDGPGVPAGERAAIFERFTRLDEARTRDRGGAGLGLAVVAGVVQRSGGTIAVTDSPLGGARFVVRFSI